MSVFRAFIAVDLSSEVQQRLAQISLDLEQSLKDLPVRWVSVAKIHLTIKFLGDISVSNVGMLTEIIQSTAAGRDAFEISIGGLGAFPNKRRPRVIWVGVEAPMELQAIHRQIEMEVMRLGYEAEKRRYSPHLTLGRVSRNVSLKDARMISKVLKEKTVGFLGVTRVRKVHLYRSDLQPSGAVYTKMVSASLR